MIVVVDTSALIRLYIPDGPMPDGLVHALQEAERGNVRVLAPELLLAEAAQVLHKKRVRRLISADECKDILNQLLLLRISFIPHAAMVVRACELAHQVGLTVYDALFLALAEHHSAHLITADDTLRDAAHALHLP